MLTVPPYELIDRSARTQSIARAAQRDARSARVASLLLRSNDSHPAVDPKDVLGAALEAALEVALGAAQTQLGNVQLLDRRGILRIHAQRVAR